MKTMSPNCTFDLKEGVNETTDQVKDFAVKIGNKFGSGYQSASRSVKRIKNSLDDSIEDVRHGIRERPLTAVAGATLGAFAIGVLAGWLASSRRSS